MQVRLKPVYSKLADPSEVTALGLAAKLPIAADGTPWRLSQHQVDTYRALTAPDGPDVVFNTAMTGDGKSLAAYLPTLVGRDYHAFGMYPTIELSRDQERQFANYQEQFRRPLSHSALWGSELTRLAEMYEFARRADALKEQFNNRDVILTNPDIFNLVMNYRYESQIFTPQELPYSLSTNFDAFIFDEFHIFSMPQIVAALTAMLYITESGGKHRFLFSSATPNATLVEMAQRSGLRCQHVAGTYQSEPGVEYRAVLHPVSLHVHQLQEKQTAEDWLQGFVPQIVEMWQTHSVRPKGAIILNSVAAARRIARLLDSALKPHGISIGENTGLTDSERRRLSLQCDIVVGTSTIDVGVDFSINLLVFESTNAGTFLQRLGRLGRVRMDGTKFDLYVAHALISGRTPWIYGRMVEAFANEGIESGAEVDRAANLTDIATAAFPVENDFIGYAKRWGVLQAAHVVNILEQKRSQGAYLSLAQALTANYTKLFGLSDINKARKRYWYLSDENHRSERRPVLDEVIAFRGSSPFQIGCWDASVSPSAFLTYDLFSIVQTADFEVIPVGEFKEALADRFPDEAQRNEVLSALKYVMKTKNDEPLTVRINEFRSERGWLKLSIGEELSVMSDQVCVLRNLTIAEPSSTQLGAVNAALKRQPVVCYATRFASRELRRMLRLPTHFPLYEVKDVNRNREYTITFGKPALMLDSLLIGWRKRNIEDEPIIC